MPRGTTFPKELRERAVRMVAEIGDLPPAEKEQMYYAEQEQNEKASCVR